MRSKLGDNIIGGDVPKYDLKGIIRMDDYTHNSIREFQIATCYSNDEKHYVKTLLVTRSAESDSGPINYEFKEA